MIGRVRSRPCKVNKRKHHYTQNPWAAGINERDRDFSPPTCREPPNKVLRNRKAARERRLHIVLANDHCVTVKTPVLQVLPPAAVIAMGPVFAPLGTVAVACVSEFTVKLALTPLKCTFVVCVRLTPVMVTGVPTGPLVGLKLKI